MLLGLLGSPSRYKAMPLFWYSFSSFSSGLRKCFFFARDIFCSVFLPSFRDILWCWFQKAPDRFWKKTHGSCPKIALSAWCPYDLSYFGLGNYLHSPGQNAGWTNPFAKTFLFYAAGLYGHAVFEVLATACRISVSSCKCWYFNWLKFQAALVVWTGAICLFSLTIILMFQNYAIPLSNLCNFYDFLSKYFIFIQIDFLYILRSSVI